MKVLLVCESLYKYASGGKVIRYLTELLNANNHIVKIIVLGNPRDDYSDEFHNNNDITYLRKNSNIYSKFRHVFQTPVSHAFEKIITDFDPDVTHIANFSFSTPAIIIDIAIRNSINVVLQPFTYHFFCQQGYAYRNGKACRECSKFGYKKAIKNKCISNNEIFYIISYSFLKKRIINNNVRILSSNIFMDNVFLDLGVSKKNLYRFPIPYKVKPISQNFNSNSYFAFYGQPKDFKGLKLIINVFKDLKNIQLKIFPSNEYKLLETIKNIEIINNLSWSNGLENVIRQAKAVIIPSIWPTSTEYTLYEAMNFAKPIIAFNVGAHKELLINRYNAMLSDSDDTVKFVENIKEVNKNQILREKIGKNALKTLMKLNDPKVLYDKLSKVYGQ